eukprot:CAMPEP_0185567222 /NCGR_PEP_ID=MMETSP0434-20130131/567_1 /TAXON_ID=626734 ORGANISM="Favella taraikaensis, Strain Fe Narragansett Bay" /NCGR_SAMPLE_ID=MMETSP0434 /ASSEMBLY_ACC=CAM_ASM_000379 /LENGTH=65 /DNA_ID=CAMNT_0028181411 /DNA_START=157 /DNA_END=354 /DNA_ORIENTATION=+
MPGVTIERSGAVFSGEVREADAALGGDIVAMQLLGRLLARAESIRFELLADEQRDDFFPAQSSFG